MKSFSKDITDQFNADGFVKLDVSGWQNITFHILNPGDPVVFLGSNDSVAITGISDGNAVSSENYYPIQAVFLADGSDVANAAQSGLYSIKILCKYIQIEGSSASKIIYFENKPY